MNDVEEAADANSFGKPQSAVNLALCGVDDQNERVHCEDAQENHMSNHFGPISLDVWVKGCYLKVVTIYHEDCGGAQTCTQPAKQK